MSRTLRRIGAGVAIAALAGASAAAAGTIERVSVKAGGGQLRSGSRDASLSPDGRYVAFTSSARDLVPGDTNGYPDVFVKDRASGGVVRVDVTSDGGQAALGAFTSSISADGTHVAFDSRSKLVPDPAVGDGTTRVYVRNLHTGRTKLVSLTDDGRVPTDDAFWPAISADGTTVAFLANGRLSAADDDDNTDVYVRDLRRRTTELVSIGAPDTGVSVGHVAISADGRYVAFVASHFLPGETSYTANIYVRDRQAGTTELVNVPVGKSRQANRTSFEPSISADGRYVAFSSRASNLVRGDTNRAWDVFVRDRVAQTTTRVSVDSAGNQSAGGDAWNDGRIMTPRIAGDGSAVAFASVAPDLVAGDGNGTSDIFVHELASGATRRVSVDTAGGDADGPSILPSLSADGSTVAFQSKADDLVAGDTNRQHDIFVHQG